jgi:hypothetical protein
MTLPRLFLFVLIGAVLWIALAASLVFLVATIGWVNLLLGLGAFMALALVGRSLLAEPEYDDEPVYEPEPGLPTRSGPHDWMGEL